MTDDVQPRVDLSAVDAHRDAAREELVIAGVMARVAALHRKGAADAARLRAARRWLLAAAAVLVVAAAGAVRIAPRRPGAEDPSALVGDWAQSNHVPTNGELLAAFQGYRP
jgi:hypothetical protein